MSVDLKQLWLRKRNTNHYSVDSSDGEDGVDDPNHFRILIPPAAYPENQASQYGLFCLKSMWVIGQNVLPVAANTRCSGATTYDPSGFYVEINGLGIQPIPNTSGGRVRGTNSFFVPNKYGSTDNVNSLSYQVVSGGYNGDGEVSCGNPSGTMIEFKIFDVDTGALMANSGNYEVIVEFSIELLNI